ncbi:hypothetical protein PRIPAC_83976 [Pristionchus pacificus]|uniref:Ion channel n=1 Tax=Pristionchus pacificus TaxID=54126 RepID=A0A2A6C4X9_PRIPA|nr:hypothetical protein PRIPAC_83976 [Pristionchus pacificus]|eukprot:PDM73189.1 ion channel [Pristionchus pacificus]
MRLFLLFTSFLYVSSTMNRHERKRTMDDSEIDYEDDEEDEEDDYENFDSKEESPSVEWVPVMSRNLSGSVYDNIHSPDREMIRKISDFLNYSYHQMTAESAAKSRDSSISIYCPSTTMSWRRFLLLLSILVSQAIACSKWSNYGCNVGYCSKDNQKSDCTCTQCTCYDTCLTGAWCQSCKTFLSTACRCLICDFKPNETSVLNTTACNNCLKSPCPNTQNYTCTNGYNTRTCDCIAGNTGNNCEFKIGDPCTSYPCMNGATCSSNADMTAYKCTCPSDRFGTQCQFSGDPCSNITCASTGKCTPIFDVRLTTWTDSTCEEIRKSKHKLNEMRCESHRRHGQFASVRTDIKERRTPLGTAGCLLVVSNLNTSSLFERHIDDLMTLDKCYEYMMANTKYQVYVVAGSICYVGENPILTTPANFPDCDDRCLGKWQQKCGTRDHAWQFLYTYTNETAQCAVAPTPCNVIKNQGYCVEQNNSFSCVCAPGWTGSDCNTANNPCSSLYCKNGGQCTPTADKSFAYCVCPKGYSSSDCSVKDQCFFTPCQNGGTCSSTSNSYTCQCDSAYAGTNCEIYLACSSSPCKHGTCTNSGTSGQYTCACIAGWTGGDCDEDINECTVAAAKTPVQTLCFNTGTCVNNPGSYSCDCVNGTYGADCSINPDDCNMTYVGLDGNNYTNLCHYYDPNAKCNDGYATYTCTCSPAWKGAMCDKDVDECADAAALTPPESLCENFGTCINTPGSYKCNCIKGAFGFNCSESKLNPRCPLSSFITPQIPYPDDCALSNEFVDGEYWPNKCISRDHYFREPNCTDGFAEYTCNCSIYWTGEFCMTDVDECKVNDPYPCENNGTCINTPGFYECDCLNGTEGFNCSINPNDCENITQCGLSDPLGNCTDGFAKWWCTCGPDYTGQFCDLEMIIYRVLQLIGGSSANEKDLIKMMRDLLTNPSMMKDLVPFVIGLQSKENRTKMSWSAEDLFEWITYEEKTLNLESDLEMWNDVVLGNCFTFNHFNNTRSYLMRQDGALGGLKAAMKLNTNEYVPWTETTAMMTFIHPNSETIFSESPRYNAEPGAHTTIQTTESRFVRLGGRYGKCVKSIDEVKSYYYDGSYTTDGCLRSCYQDEVLKACTCMDSRYPKDPDAKACELPDRDCVDSITKKGDVSKWAHCECPLPCTNSQFDASFTMAPFVIGSAKCNTLNGMDRLNDTACNTKGEKPDYLLLSVQVPRLIINIFEEKASWSFNKVIGNIGGLGGVVCGINLITFFEFGFFFFVQLPLTLMTNRQIQ